MSQHVFIIYFNIIKQYQAKSFKDFIDKPKKSDLESEIMDLKNQLNEERNSNQKLINDNHNLVQNINKLNTENGELKEKIKKLEKILEQNNIQI